MPFSDEKAENRVNGALPTGGTTERQSMTGPTLGLFRASRKKTLLSVAITLCTSYLEK